MDINSLKESFNKHGCIYFRRKGWNEEWIYTTSPIWNFGTFEYKTVEEMNEQI